MHTCSTCQRVTDPYCGGPLPADGAILCGYCADGEIGRLQAQVRLLQESVVKAREEAYRTGQVKICKLLAPAFYDALFHTAPKKLRDENASRRD